MADLNPISAWRRFLALPNENRFKTVAIAFIVSAGSLGLSVAVFTICALTTIAVLYYRRVTIGAELGGPKASAKRHAALLVGLWLVYIVASILSTEGMI